MPITILRLLAFDGPNLYGPQPGVALLVRAERDLSARMRGALKDAALAVGVMIARLEVDVRPESDGFLLEIRFVTATSALGAELARYVVDGLNAQQANDEEWDPEEPLWQLQRRRRAASLPVEALQIIAEAGARDLPAFVRADGMLQVGYGARGRALSVARAGGSPGLLAPESIGVGAPLPTGNEAAAALPWAQVGRIPILTLCGGPAAAEAARLLAAQLPGASLAQAAGFDAARALLADPAVQLAVLGLEMSDLALRGAPFDRCSACALLDLPGTPPPDIGDPAQLARALGVPMLLTDPTGVAAINADEPALLALAEYAPCPVVLLSARPDSSAIAAHRTNGGAALFLRNGTIIAAHGPAEQLHGPAPADQPLGALAALALAEYTAEAQRTQRPER
ncbi:MAG TPA: DUF4938 domain-containing protein [Roseiflexaceae bacterium]|nr:DUF4938 domain-containing protein [Roseiflexaceae bacterium]